MPNSNLHSMHATEFISTAEIEQLKKLQALCYDVDHTNLKLELDYKYFLSTQAQEKALTTDKKEPEASPKTNEFFYYIGETLIAYLGLSSFGGNIGELNGMTHPDYRRKGYFKLLLEMAINECKNRHFNQLLLLTDAKSEAGVNFITSNNGIYEHSEYRMRLGSFHNAVALQPSITLSLARRSDAHEIAKLNAILFGDEMPSDSFDADEDQSTDLLLDNPENVSTYRIALDGKTIGKINVEYNTGSAFLFGFGIHPDYRKKGYGRAALSQLIQHLQKEGVQEIGLDVVCTNSNALNLYKSCGFEEVSVMNYYEYKV